MSNLPNKLAADPTLKDLLDIFGLELMKRFKCHDVGTIQSFDPDTQTAQVTINYKRTFPPATPTGNPQVKEYPALLNVPVFFPQGGGFQLTFPVKKGNTCIIAYNDRDLDNWFQSGQIGPVASSRMHSMSDGMAFIGINPSSSPIEGFDTDRAVLGNGTTMVGVGATLVKIANGTYTLNGLLQEFVTDVENLCTAVAAAITVPIPVGGLPDGAVLNPATIAAINAAKTALSTTATKISGLLE